MTANNSPSEKRWIRPLPERLINKIAAGEVIERPAAVLKELVENSLDAGASRVDIIIEKSGIKSISIVDDGCGIEADQIEIAFSRHATSKIRNFDDLEALLSFGFRGEALPSIGSVSKTRMVSRTADTESGREIIIEGGVIQSVKPVASPVGTKVEVEDLFYNTPARRKFLKTESTEARHLTRTATAMALSVPNVRFSYAINGRRLFLLGKNTDDLRLRIAELLFGKESTPLLELQYSTDKLKVLGYLSYPDNCRRNRNGIYLYINKRYIFSPTMIHAITAGYAELLPSGNFPVGALFLEIDPKQVDVNVHPTKAEVRLSEEKEIHDLLYHIIKRSLRSAMGMPSATGSAKIETVRDNYTAAEAIGRLKSFITRESSGTSSDLLEKLYGAPKQEAGLSDAKADNISSEATVNSLLMPQETVDTSNSESGGIRYLGQLSRLYLLFISEENLLIVDQHTAHERILYEENLQAIESGKAISQSLLFPINIDLSAERFAVYEEASEILKSAGIISEPFGATTVMLSAVSASLTRKSPEKIFDEILGDVENLHRGGEDLKKAVAQSIACRAAIMAGDRLTDEEALGLFKRLEKVDNRHCCPHGRPTMLKLSKAELDKNSEENRPTIPILTGPTASGKTSLAIALAEIYPQIEIISADSRQIYRYMKIGTDKPSEELMLRCKFHLVDFVSPGERYTAFDFVEDSRKILADVLNRGKLPLICGGTGLYIRSLVEGIFEIPEGDFSIRSGLEDEIITKGPEFLYKRLQTIDPEEADKVHPHNVKRIIRALEIYYQSGKPKSNLINQPQPEPDLYNYDIVCLMPPRDELYRRINDRVDAMIEAGLPDEVETIINKGLKEAVSRINVIGYNELFRYFGKEISLETAINLIKQNSRRYAKRQITWFNGMENIKFFDSKDILKDYLSGVWNKN